MKEDQVFYLCQILSSSLDWQPKYEWFSCSEYWKNVGMRCIEEGYGDYSTLERAKLACSIDNKCQGVYDLICGEGPYYLCPINAQLENSDSSCGYRKCNRE